MFDDRVGLQQQGQGSQGSQGSQVGREESAISGQIATRRQFPAHTLYHQLAVSHGIVDMRRFYDKVLSLHRHQHLERKGQKCLRLRCLKFE